MPEMFVFVCFVLLGLLALVPMSVPLWSTSDSSMLV